MQLDANGAGIEAAIQVVSGLRGPGARIDAAVAVDATGEVSCSLKNLCIAEAAVGADGGMGRGDHCPDAGAVHQSDHTVRSMRGDAEPTPASEVSVAVGDVEGGD